MTTKFRRPPTVRQSSRPRGAMNTSVHGREDVHETPAQAGQAAHQVPRSDEDDTWARPTNLTAPPPRPGKTQRWIRAKINNNVDSKRLSRARQEGWRPRPPDSVPEDFSPEAVHLSGIGNVISADDMVLMEMDTTLFHKRSAYFERRKHRQMEAVNEDLMKVETQGGLPIQRRRKTQVTVGRGRKVEVD